MLGHGFRSARYPHLPSRREMFSARGAVRPAGGWLHVSQAGKAAVAAAVMLGVRAEPSSALTAPSCFEEVA